MAHIGGRAHLGVAIHPLRLTVAELGLTEAVGLPGWLPPQC